MLAALRLMGLRSFCRLPRPAWSMPAAAGDQTEEESVKLCLQPSERGSIPGIRGIAILPLAMRCAALGVLVTPSALAAESCPSPPTPERELGRLLFNDVNLSISRTQSCASCHVEARAFTGNNAPDPFFPVALGALPTLVGIRNTPTAKYTSFTPVF